MIVALSSDVYAATVEDDASEVDEHPLAGEYQVAIVAVEGRFHEDIRGRVRKQLAGDARHVGSWYSVMLSLLSSFFTSPRHARISGVWASYGSPFCIRLSSS